MPKNRLTIFLNLPHLRTNKDNLSLLSGVYAEPRLGDTGRRQETRFSIR